MREEKKENKEVMKESHTWNRAAQSVSGEIVSLLLCKRQANIVTKVTKDITKYR
jgi:hypothetical protein